MPANLLENIAKLEVTPAVYLRKNIRDAWVRQPYLYWLTAQIQLPPSISSAELVYLYGEHEHRHDQLSESIYPPLEINGHFAKLVTIDAQGNETKVCNGYIGAVDAENFSNTEVVGKQQFRFYGFEKLLSEREIRGSYFYEVSDINVPYDSQFERLIDQRFSFNVRSITDVDINGKGQLKGNRHPRAKTFAHYAALHEPVKKWSVLDILLYLTNEHHTALLPFIGTPDVEWELAASLELRDALDRVYSVYEQPDNFKQLLDELLPRELGLDWFIDVVDPTNPNDPTKIKLVVNTLYPDYTTIGTITFPPNSTAIDYTIPVTLPESHFHRLPIVSIDESRNYNRIEVRGAPARVMFNLTAEDAGIFRDWSEDEETRFIGPNINPATINASPFLDYARSQDHLEHVFSRFAILPPWGWVDDANQYLLPRFITRVTEDNPNPHIEWEMLPRPADHNHHDTLLFKRLDRELPIVAGIDYTVSPPVDRNDKENPDRTYRTPWVAATVDNRKVMVDKLNDFNPDYTPAHLTMLDDKPGFQVHGELLLLAKNHVSGIVSQHTPLADWETLYGLFSMTLGIYPKFVSTIAGAEDGTTSHARNLIIEVPDAEFWFTLFSTVLNYDADGNEEIIHPDNLVLRQDFDRLEQVAAFTLQWFNRSRTAMTIDVMGLGLGLPLIAPPGYLLKKVIIPRPDGSIVEYTTNSIVSTVTLDALRQVMTLQTDYSSLEQSLPAMLNML